MDRLHLDNSNGEQTGGRRTSRAARPAHAGTAPRGPMKFPEGGVFGVGMAPTLEQVEDALTIARSIEMRLDRMQAQLHELEAELDDPYVFPFARLSNDPDDTRPMAA